MEFYKTVMGHKFFEGDVPALIRELKALNENLSRKNVEQTFCPTVHLAQHLDEGWLYVGSFTDNGETFCIVERRKEATK